MGTETKIEVKSRPILFSGPMVRAILEGRKTQTRRVVKGLPDGDTIRTEHDQNDMPFYVRVSGDGEIIPGELTCPYGVPGDRLWVREEHFRYGHWEPVEGVKTRTGRQKWLFFADWKKVLFELPDYKLFRRAMDRLDPSTPVWHKRLARFMPRWASRITLEITGVRVERLQDISEADARAEGVDDPEWHKSYCNSDGDFIEPEGVAVEAFQDLWNSINGEKKPKHIRRRVRSGKPTDEYDSSHIVAESWAANPWVWVIEFQRVKGGK